MIMQLLGQLVKEKKDKQIIQLVDDFKDFLRNNHIVKPLNNELITIDDEVILIRQFIQWGYLNNKDLGCAILTKVYLFLTSMSQDMEFQENCKSLHGYFTGVVANLENEKIDMEFEEVDPNEFEF